MPAVNPEILKWARETAGLSKDDAVAKLNLRAARGVEPVDRLRELENGTNQPTRAMLVKMTKQYRRPLLTFYLSAPPLAGNRGQDFRTLPQDHLESDEALLDALIRSVQSRQGLVRSAILDEDDTQPLDFIGSASMEDGSDALVSSICEVLGVSHVDLQNARSPDEAFRVLREHVEDAGAFVLLLGNLGSYHTNIDLDTFRGFALADDIAPFIVVNDQDNRAAWSFTLVHELAHLLLGQTGVSGGAPVRRVERFCSDVASEFLLPAADLEEIRIPERAEVNEVASLVSAFAEERNVSRSMVAYKLYRNERIGRNLWEDLSRYFRDRWLDEREHRRGQTSPVDYYVVRRHRLGTGLVQLTARLMATGALTTSKAGQVLGVKPKNVETLIGHNRVGAR
jgi:Zn-dependent peptidase ImmA (M78 family)